MFCMLYLICTENHESLLYITDVIDLKYCGYIWYDSAHSTTTTLIKLRLDFHSRMTPYNLRARYGVFLVSYPKKMSAIYREPPVLRYLLPRWGPNVQFRCGEKYMFMFMMSFIFLRPRQIEETSICSPPSPVINHLNNSFRITKSCNGWLRLWMNSYLMATVIRWLRRGFKIRYFNYFGRYCLVIPTLKLGEWCIEISQASKNWNFDNILPLF